MKLKFAIYIWLIVVQTESLHHHQHISKINKSKKIHGSLPTRPERWKFMALIEISKQAGNSFYCSAILINNRSLLTAAHCLKNYSKMKPLIILLKGLTFKTFDFDKDLDYLLRTNTYKIHEKFLEADNFWEEDLYDVAIVKLENAIVLDPKKGIDKVDLPISPNGKQYPFDPNNCYLVAYGEEKPIYPDYRLQEIKVPILPNHVCKRCEYDIEREICFGYNRKPSCISPKSSAGGDSGGAFLCKTIHFNTDYGKRTKIPKYILVAMNILHDKGDKKQERFSVGIRITKIMDWIQRNS